jgi:superfamily II DNA/RNA helicase
MPGVDYVYSLDAPTTAASYLHRAGRCGRLGATSTGVVTAVVTPEEEEILDQAMNDLEIAKWVTLEEENVDSLLATAKRAEAASQVAREDDEADEGVEGGEEGEGGEDGGFGEGKDGVEDEERVLTTAALNDIFYTLDAQAEMVNQLEDIFAADDASKKDSWENWEEGEDEEDRADEEKSARLKAAIDDVKSIFSADVSDEDMSDYLRKKKDDEK